MITYMENKETTFVEEVLYFIYEATKLLPLPFETPYQWSKRNRGMSRPNYYASIFQLQKRGVLKITEKNNKKFVQLTNKGQLEVLLSKAQVAKTEKWDGKWRIIIYDIPEDSKPQRHLFRKLLRKNGFYKLQASVFISPYSLNKEALEYLKASGLINYIRIIRADAMDYDTDLLKKFNLNHN